MSAAGTERPATGGLRVVCIAPAWNEGERVARTVAEVPRDLIEQVVVVDDGSTDDTAALAEAAGAVVIRQGRNQGVGAAIRAGLDYALAQGFDVAVIVSGGGKTPPAQIPALLGPIFSGRADLVQGSRYLSGGQGVGMPLQRRLGTVAYTRLFSALCRHPVSDASSGFRAIRLSIFADHRINLWQEWLDRYELEPYLLFQALRLRHRVVEVPVRITYPQDSRPYTKMRAVLDWWRIFRPAVFLSLHIKK